MYTYKYSYLFRNKQSVNGKTPTTHKTTQKRVRKISGRLWTSLKKKFKKIPKKNLPTRNFVREFLSIFFFVQVAGKRDPEQEREAQAWIEAVIGERFPPGRYEDVLRDGIILCKLMNRLSPGIIPKINVSGGDYKMMDNLSQ